ncbi:hypothetical protein [Tenacibaculum phage PTm5]|uniref:Uncharacterized protein n=1 Tax=Tenacibaculum phage PTm5 TaxID=2547426 RepID=A0A5S9BZH6_9CAUD|nr:hypothetical protein [Tenacibaculum phage PTm5]
MCVLYLGVNSETMYEIGVLKLRRHSTKSAIDNLHFDMQSGMLPYDDYVEEYYILSEHFDVLERAIKIYREKLIKELNKKSNYEDTKSNNKYK